MPKKITVKVPRSSGKNLSHRNAFTGKCGTLMPILFYEPPVGSKMKLRMALDLRMPPLASETYANIDYRCEAFFVPLRLLFKGFEDYYAGQSPIGSTLRYVPPTCVTPTPYTLGSLPDMLGCKTKAASSGNTVTALPFIAYHLIWQEWYRNTLVQKPAFVPPVEFAGQNPAYNNRGCHLPYMSFIDGAVTAALGKPSLNGAADLTTFDGKSIFDLRQRNFGYDYFTSATPQPQLGDGMSVQIEPTGDGEFSISALRAANSLQQFAERNLLAGTRLVDVIKARFGVNLSNSVAQRPVLLGSCSIPVYSVGVNQTSGSETVGGDSANPFREVGATYGKVSCSGNELLIDDFSTEEPGYVMVLGSLVPRVQYSTGLSRQLTRYISGKDSYVDNANPMLQNIGNQPIYSRELSGSASESSVFGYQSRYADWHKMDDEVHGLFVDGASLQSFVLQRSLLSNPVLSDSFLQIPTDYLDQIFAFSATSEGDEYISYQADTYWDFRVVNGLSDYAIPSLQDPSYEHGRDVVVKVAGTQL